MPDENRFAGLGDAVDDRDASETSTSETSASETSTDSRPEAGSPDDPHFSFEEASQRSIYIQEETLRKLDDTRHLIDTQFRMNHDIRNLTGREFYDALLTVAIEHFDEVQEVLAERRGVDDDSPSTTTDR